MRFDGTLSKWDDNRGFGFIAPAQGGHEIFVHISSFACDGRRPQLQESLTFEIELDQKGEKRAVNVLRPAKSPPGPPRLTQRQPPGQARSSIAKWVAMALLIAVGMYGYTQYSKLASAHVPADTGISFERPAARSLPTSRSRRCDGRLHCSQMTSCEEATFFLNNCPGVKMDGDHDGVPCEEQLCTNPLAN